jgi:hypothetical protein
MIRIHNATGTLSDDELLRALADQVEPAVSRRLEEWCDAAATLANHGVADAYADGRERGVEEGRGERQPYVDAWEDVFGVWEDGYSTGRWPGASPEDQHFLAVMTHDFRRGAEALELLRQIAAGKFVDAEREALEFLNDSTYAA